MLMPWLSSIPVISPIELTVSPVLRALPSPDIENDPSIIEADYTTHQVEPDDVPHAPEELDDMTRHALESMGEEGRKLSSQGSDWWREQLNQKRQRLRGEE